MAIDFLAEFFTRGFLKTFRKPRRRGTINLVKPLLEILEDRTLLADPSWIQMGPMPQSDPHVDSTYGAPSL